MLRIAAAIAVVTAAAASISLYTVNWRSAPAATLSLNDELAVFLEAGEDAEFADELDSLRRDILSLEASLASPWAGDDSTDPLLTGDISS